MSRRRATLPLLFMLGLSLAVGCGSSEFSTVEGTVTLDDQPLPKATVVFSAPNMPLATAKTDANGAYRVETGSIEGMKPGQYTVTIAAYAEPQGGDGDAAPRLAVPKRYLDKQASGLSADISQGPNRNVDFALTSD